MRLDFAATWRDALARIATGYEDDDDGERLVRYGIATAMAHADADLWAQLITAPRGGSDDDLLDAFTATVEQVGGAAGRRGLDDGALIVRGVLVLGSGAVTASIIDAADQVRTACEGDACVYVSCNIESCCAACICDAASIACGCESDACADACIRCDATEIRIGGRLADHIGDDGAGWRRLMAMTRRFRIGDYGLAGATEIEHNTDTLRYGVGTLLGRYGYPYPEGEIWIARDVGEGAPVVAIRPSER